MAILGPVPPRCQELGTPSEFESSSSVGLGQMFPASRAAGSCLSRGENEQAVKRTVRGGEVSDWFQIGRSSSEPGFAGHRNCYMGGHHPAILAAK